MKLSDFLIKDWKTGLFIPDFYKLKGLSDSEFIEAHDNEMDLFIKNHLRFTGDFPKCSRCGLKLRDPERLIRYYGENLHNGCFIEAYWTEKFPEMNEDGMDYFNRLQKLVA